MKHEPEASIRRPTWLLAAVLLSLAQPPTAHAQDEMPESCRQGVSRDVVLAEVLDEAAFVGLKPPENSAEIRVAKIEALTAEEHDRRYQTSLMGGIPVVEPWECYWRVELEGAGWWCGGPPGAFFCMVFRDFWAGVAGETGRLQYYYVLRAEDPRTIWLPVVGSR